jgi:hypothetical protein
MLAAITNARVKPPRDRLASICVKSRFVADLLHSIEDAEAQLQASRDREQNAHGGSPERVQSKHERGCLVLKIAPLV